MRSLVISAGLLLFSGSLVAGTQPATPVRATPGMADLRAAPTPAMQSGVPIGPDVIVGQVGLDPGTAFGSFANYPSASGYRAYAVNTTSCNIGDAPLSWRDGTPSTPDNRHPVIAQNMYRYTDGRFEQIGLSWLKHGFCALSEELCGTCTGPFDCDDLSPGCSDPYSAGTNGGFPAELGPRHEVNPRTGDFPFPFISDPPLADSTSRRLRVLEDDVSTTLYPNATWIVEAHYITADDAQAGNDLNNASHREVTIDSSGAIANFASPTVQTTPAIMAWQTLDAQATVTAVDVPDAGRYYVGHAARELPNGTWAYEYAIMNYNSDQPAHQVSVDLGTHDCVTEIGFRGVEYIEGEPSDNANWAIASDGGSLVWSTAPLHDDPASHVLRWGTLYNFRFVSSGAPTMAFMTIDLADDVSPTPNTSTVQVAVLVPGGTCAADCAPIGGNGIVNIDDILGIVNGFGTMDEQCDVTPVNGDCTIGNGAVNVDDIIAALNQFGPC